MAFWTDITFDVPLEGPAQPAERDPTLAQIERCLAGETAAYAILFRRHAGFVYRLVYGLLRHREDAEEVLQDTFEYAFRRLHRYDPGRSAFKTWLYRIAVSRCRNKRRRKVLPTFPLAPSDGPDGAADPVQIRDEQAVYPDEAFEQRRRREIVWSALGELSPKLRETAYLRYFEGFSYQEIGQVLAIPAKTAESRMRLAHQALKALLAGRL